MCADVGDKGDRSIGRHGPVDGLALGEPEDEVGGEGDDHGETCYEREHLDAVSTNTVLLLEMGRLEEKGRLTQAYCRRSPTARSAIRRVCRADGTMFRLHFVSVKRASVGCCGKLLRLWQLSGLQHVVPRYIYHIFTLRVTFVAHIVYVLSFLRYAILDGGEMNINFFF